MHTSLNALNLKGAQDLGTLGILGTCLKYRFLNLLLTEVLDILFKDLCLSELPSWFRCQHVRTITSKRIRSNTPIMPSFGGHGDTVR